MTIGLGETLLATEQAGREAGLIAMRYFRQDHEQWEKGPGQIVTEADLEIDRFLKSRLAEIVPQAGWFSEETADDGSRRSADYLWVVDPIDGTRTFAAGKPEFTISIALLHSDLPVLGVVFNPAKNTLYSATLGGGAALNGTAIKTKAAARIDGASIAVSEGENRRRRFESLFPRSHITTIGSLAYKIVLVAEGAFDAYFSWRNACDWDIAAAVLVLEEAGGRISDASGMAVRFNEIEPIHRGIIAAPSGLHGALVQSSVRSRQSSGNNSTSNARRK